MLEHVPDILSKIDSFILTMTEETRERRKYWAAQALIKEDEERKKRDQAAEEQKFKDLLSEADRFHRAQVLREYLNTMKAKAEAKGILTTEFIQWLEWAALKADSIDPSRV